MWRQWCFAQRAPVEFQHILMITRRHIAYWHGLEMISNDTCMYVYDHTYLKVRKTILHHDLQCSYNQVFWPIPVVQFTNSCALYHFWRVLNARFKA